MSDKVEKMGTSKVKQLTTGCSEGDVINWGGSLPPSIELDIHKWLQDSEEVMHIPVSGNVSLKEKVEYMSLPSVKVNIKEWL